jgi:uncharacterized protein
LPVRSRLRPAKGRPRSHLWNPAFCGDIDLRIAADGTWHYQKTPIGRPALVKLFASILKRDATVTFLSHRWKNVESQ